MNNPLELTPLIEKLKKYDEALTTLLKKFDVPLTILLKTKNYEKASSLSQTIESEAKERATIFYFKNLVNLFRRLAEINAQSIFQILNKDTNLDQMTSEQLLNHLDDITFESLFSTAMTELVESYQNKMKAILLINSIFGVGVMVALLLNDSFFQSLPTLITAISATLLVTLFVSSIIYFSTQKNELIELNNTITQPKSRHYSISYFNENTEGRRLGLTLEAKELSNETIKDCFFNINNDKPSLFNQFEMIERGLT